MAKVVSQKSTDSQMKRCILNILEAHGRNDEDGIITYQNTKPMLWHSRKLYNALKTKFGKMATVAEQFHIHSK